MPALQHGLPSTAALLPQATAAAGEPQDLPAWWCGRSLRGLGGVQVGLKARKKARQNPTSGETWMLSSYPKGKETALSPFLTSERIGDHGKVE